MPPSFAQIKYEVMGPVAVVSLNRPDVSNAVSRAMAREIDSAFKLAELQDDIRCVLLRGEGRNFCSGHDLGSDLQLQDKSFPQEIDPRPRGDYAKWYNLDVELCLNWRRLRKPVVAAIKGYTIYHGTVLAACADVVIASDDLRYMPSLVEANLFPWVVKSTMQAKALLFTQRFATAEEAVRLGIALRAVPAADLDAECLRLCNLIARGDAFHLWMMKKMVNAAQDAAGMDAHVRSALDTWVAFRRDWSETTEVKTKDHGGKTKRLAPVRSALVGDAWRETEIMSKL